MAEKSKQGRLDTKTMFPLIELFEESGMTQKQFCIEMDIVPHTFTYWLNKYRKRKKPGMQKSKPEFVELEISSNRDLVTTDRLIRITYSDGTLVELPVG